MKLILVNQRCEHNRTGTIVIKGWLNGLLSLCLLGVPVALGYWGYQLAFSQQHGVIISQKASQVEEPQEQVRPLGQLRRHPKVSDLSDPGHVVAQVQTLALAGNAHYSATRYPHFDTYKNGRPIDPASYIRRTHR